RELLLRELAAVIRQEASASRVVIIEPSEDVSQRVVIGHGSSPKECEAWAEEFSRIRADVFAKKHDVAVINLKPHNAPPATVLISPRKDAELAGGLSLDPLLRVVELGMDVCALRLSTRAEQRDQETVSAGSSLMPGFIHSSPAM